MTPDGSVTIKVVGSQLKRSDAEEGMRIIIGDERTSMNLII